MASATGHLDALPPLRWDDGCAVTVVVAAAGYPGQPRVGDRVDGLAEAAAVDGAYVLHAGTRLTDDGRVVSAGGRVLSVTGLGADLAQARSRAYDAVSRIRFPGAHHRRDIARAAERGEVVVP